MTAEVRQRESGIVLGRVGLHCCPEEQDGEAFILIHPLAHRSDKIGLRDVLSVSW